ADLVHAEELNGASSGIRLRLEDQMSRVRCLSLAAMVLVVWTPDGAKAWDHPGHMTTAAIAFAEIERQRPELLEKIGLLMLAQPDRAPFWLAAGDAKGKERARRMFIEAARWPDDIKFTVQDRPTWHSARWAIVADDAPPEVREIALARGDQPTGNAIEAAVLNSAVLANSESKPEERAIALCWMMHIVGDIHQPLHVSDQYSAISPTGNAAGTLEYVWDPLRDSAMPFHLLWDSNAMRSTEIADIDRYSAEIRQKFPRESLPELVPLTGPDDYRLWARESYEVAVDFAYGYGIKTVGDPNKDVDSDRLIGNMIKYILEGVSPVQEAPPVPDEYWERLQREAQRRIALAGYRIADVVIAAADRIFANRALSGRVLDSMPRHGPAN
ncbi:S1/P1 nuclease, partial [Mesorhizobium marinum]|uniref:S1/P1 nuclease n=1 Tax=Mesorhizobium marinum TaxID=3228790 RepID=UPI0034655A01